MICYSSFRPDCHHLIKTMPMTCMCPERDTSDIDMWQSVDCPYYEPGDEKPLTVALATVTFRECLEEAIDELKKHNEAILYRVFKYGLLCFYITLTVILVWSLT